MKMNISKAKRLTQLPPYLFAQLDLAKKEAQKSGKEIIDLGVGDPDLPTPSPIIEKLYRAAQESCNHRYPSYQGLFSFRQAVAEWYARRFGVSLDPEEEVLTLIGSKEGIAHLSLGLLNPGDIALVPDPAYPVYRAGVIFAGAHPVRIPLKEQNGFLPVLEDIEEKIARKTRIFFLNYPNNPTAATANIDFFKELTDFATRFRIILCHDLAYSEIAFDGYRPPSILQIEGAKQIAVEFHSLSKTFNMTGWRIGFVVGNRQVIRTLREIKTNIDSGVFQAVQEAGITALNMDGEVIEGIKKVYQKRRDLLVMGLKNLGWEIKSPKATFYLWTKIPDSFSSMNFAARLLRECGVVVTPGIGFGPAGKGYIRMALTVEEKKIIRAIERIKNFDLERS